MNQLSVQKINKEITAQLSDTETAQALLTTTFNGLTLPRMKQALMEGMMRGFTFQNFLEKDVYAIPFSSGYSLVTSIDYMRKIAAQNGIAGKDAPVFVDDENGRPKTCSVTVKRIVNGDVRDFTATVYFNEYSTGKNQWQSRPRTMIAKVAEMHALRMAFPEELSKAYIEDEDPAATPVVAIDYTEIQKEFDKCETVESVREVFSHLSKEARADKSVVEMGKARKETIEADEIKIPGHDETMENLEKLTVRPV